MAEEAAARRCPARMESPDPSGGDISEGDLQPGPSGGERLGYWKVQTHQFFVRKFRQ